MSGSSIILYRLTRLRYWLLACCACIILSAGQTFTGIIYAGILCLFYASYDFWKGQTRSPLRTQLMLPGSAVGAFLIVIFVSGFHPYVTNVLRHGTPFYPSRDAILRQIPPFYRGILPPEAFFASLFSRTVNGEPQLKWPWNLFRAEIYTVRQPDSRSGGFGPLFALQILLTTAVVVIFRRRIDRDWALVGIAMAITILPFPDPWWARYIPQLYFAVMAFLLSVQASPAGRLTRVGIGFSTIAVTTVATANAAIVGGAQLYYTHYYYERRAVEQLTNIGRRSSDVIIQRSDAPGMITTFEERLTRQGIHFRLVNNLGSCHVFTYIYHPLRYCELPQ